MLLSYKHTHLYPASEMFSGHFVTGLCVLVVSNPKYNHNTRSTTDIYSFRTNMNLPKGVSDIRCHMLSIIP